MSGALPDIGAGDADEPQLCDLSSPTLRAASYRLH